MGALEIVVVNVFFKEAPQEGIFNDISKYISECAFKNSFENFILIDVSFSVLLLDGLCKKQRESILLSCDVANYIFLLNDRKISFLL